MNVQNVHKCTIALIPHASKVMLKILQASLQHYMNFQMLKLDLEKAKEPEIKLPASVGWIIEKEREFQKTSTSLHWLCYKAFDCVGGSQQTVENS